MARELNVDSPRDREQHRTVIASLQQAMPHIVWPVWDVRLFSPCGLDDLFMLTVKVRFEEHGPWFTYTWTLDGGWVEEKE